MMPALVSGDQGSSPSSDANRLCDLGGRHSPFWASVSHLRSGAGMGEEKPAPQDTVFPSFFPIRASTTLGLRESIFPFTRIKCFPPPPSSYFLQPP